MNVFCKTTQKLTEISILNKLARMKLVKHILIFFVTFILLNTLTFANENKLNAIKFTFLSWASGSSKISYERAIPQIQQSSEICAGLISAGYDKYKNNPFGFTLRYGHKFFLGNYKQTKPFDGFFLRPEIIYSNFKYNLKNSNEKKQAQMCSLIGTIGYQKTFGTFLIDSWFGGGYAFGTPADTGYHHGFQLWNWFDTYNKNIALSFSIRLGWCF